MSAPPASRSIQTTLALRQRERFWLRVRRLTQGLLLVWAVVAVLVPWFARELNTWTVAGFPFGVWMASQGAILIFLALIVVYALVMDRLDAALRAALAGGQGVGDA